MGKKRGPPFGHKRTAESIAKGKRWGPDHHAWLGNTVSERGGRTRALRRFPVASPCALCGAPRAERHHRDGNTANNDAGNVWFLCRRCHMQRDGRLEQFKALALANQPRAAQASAMSCRRLTPSQVRTVRARYAQGETLVEIAQTVPVTASTLSGIVTRHRYKGVK